MQVAGISENSTGFEGALPSCRITDLVNDPLVKEYGQNNLRMSRIYEGSGVRVRKVLQKALRGERLKLAVVGGSVSAVRISFISSSFELCSAYTSCSANHHLLCSLGPWHTSSTHASKLHVFTHSPMVQGYFSGCDAYSKPRFHNSSSICLVLLRMLEITSLP